MTEKNTEKKTIDTDKEVVTVADDQRKVTWSYTRKKNLGNYQSEDIGIFITDNIPKSTKNIIKWVSEKSDTAFNEAKVQVWTALGLTFGFNERGDPVLDEPVPVVPQAPTPQPPLAATAPAPLVTPVTNAPAQNQRADNPSIAQVGYYHPDPIFCKDCGNQGLESFWDNRLEIDEKIKKGQKIGPDFKCRNCNGGNGKGKPLYRAGSYDYNQAVGQAPAQTMPPEPDPTPEPEEQAIF